MPYSRPLRVLLATALFMLTLRATAAASVAFSIEADGMRA